jgi:ribonuclease HI
MTRKFNEFDECVAYFDGSSNPNPGKMKIGGYIESREENGIKVQSSFSKSVGNGTNNEAEYLALIEVLNLAIEHRVKKIKIYGDSNLVVSQVNGKWKSNKKMSLFKYQAQKLLENFSEWSLSYVPREQNKVADSLTR